MNFQTYVTKDYVISATVPILCIIRTVLMTSLKTYLRKLIWKGIVAGYMWRKVTEGQVSRALFDLQCIHVFAVAPPNVAQ